MYEVYNNKNLFYKILQDDLRYQCAITGSLVIETVSPIQCQWSHLAASVITFLPQWKQFTLHHCTCNMRLLSRWNGSPREYRIGDQSPGSWPGMETQMMRVVNWLRLFLLILCFSCTTKHQNVLVIGLLCSHKQLHIPNDFKACST